MCVAAATTTDTVEMEGEMDGSSEPEPADRRSVAVSTDSQLTVPRAVQVHIRPSRVSKRVQARPRLCEKGIFCRNEF